MRLSEDQILGRQGERWVFDQLARRKWATTLHPDFANSGFDMKCLGLPIEVKIANPSFQPVSAKNISYRRQRWQWCIHEPSLDMAGDWVLILLARDEKQRIYPYVVPGAMVTQNHIQITSHPEKFRGWLNFWLWEFDVIPYLAQQTYLDDGPTYENYHAWQAAGRQMRMVA